ncbi:MAG: hypothetical protein NT090_11830 [Acidobacteria bacterium]|nr:hypothetical protein [Acidobacteriota bacterium]
MKKILFALAMIGVFAATSVAADLFAVKARIPFDFAVAGKQLPAGVYTVERQSSPGVLMLRDAAGRVDVLFLAMPVYTNTDAQTPMLVFNKYGDRYFLAKIWPATGAGAQLNPTKIERELVAAAPVEQVLVAAIYR